MPKPLYPILLLLAFPLIGYTENIRQAYQYAFAEQCRMLQGNQPICFKRAVFITENAYYGNTLNYADYCRKIGAIDDMLQAMIRNKGIGLFKTAGNWAAFTYITDTIPENNYRPYVYDFNDFVGAKNWPNMFVTKLMETHSGNCHSLPYLYKILCEDIGAKAYLALAPNHLYIKHPDEHGQWANVELTNPGFPRDQWIIKEMAITVEAIRKNIYMVPLTGKESVAMTMFDLANGYKALYGYDSFVLKVTNTALHYFPKCVPLAQMRANCLLTMIHNEQKKRKPDTATLAIDIRLHKQAQAAIASLGYKDMPVELYKDWVQSVEKEKQRRAHHNITN